MDTSLEYDAAKITSATKPMLYKIDLSVAPFDDQVRRIFGLFMFS